VCSSDLPFHPGKTGNGTAAIADFLGKQGLI
jgi:hypothetical protein